MTLNDLFKKRQTAYIKNLSKYARIIFNDHFVLILFILFGAGGFAYSNYLETLTVGLVQPRILVAILFYLVVSTGSVTLLLEPADTIFLLPKEHEFKQIFKKMTIQSFIRSLISVGIVGILTWPIFVATLDAPTTDLVFILITLGSLKWLNLLTKIKPFFEMKTQNKQTLLVTVVKILAIISLLFMNRPLTTGITVAIALYTAYAFATEKQYVSNLFNWDAMISAEENRMQRLYRFIGLFTNVPNIETHIKRLAWLDPTLDWLSQKNPTAPYYYILRTTARNTDYSMLVIRATVVGAILLAVTQSFVVSTLLILLFLYMIGFQLMTLVSEIERAPQFKMYPVTQVEKEQAVFKLIFQLLIFVAILLGVAAIGPLGIAGFALIPIGCLFAYLFSKFYAPHRIKRLY